MTRYLEMHFSGLSASDSIICSSECGRTVVANCLNNAQVEGGIVSPVTLKVIPLGIDEPPGAMDRALARKQLGLKDDQVVALGFGRFSDFDKMDLFPLLQAMKLIEGQQNRLILAGAVHDEEYFKILQLWVKALGLTDRVDFVVAPNNQKKLALFAGADFFVSIADNPQETFGLTVLEAMHAGTPVVVSDFNGYRELAGDDAGIRVPTTWIDIPRLSEVESLMDMRTLHRYLSQTLSVDMQPLTAALRAMFSDGDLRRKYGRAARSRFEAYFAHARIISQLEAHWCDQKEQFQFSSGPVNSLDMNVFNTFSHYVTKTLADSAVLKTTAFARQLLAANIDYPLLSGMSEVVNQAQVKEMARYCFKAHSVAAISEKMGDHWKIRFAMMWMLKHDLLQIVE